MFAIVSGISNHPIPMHIPGCLPDNGRKLRRVLGRSPTHPSTSNQVTVFVTDQAQFRPTAAMKVSVAGAPNIVAADMACFEAGSIHDPGGMVFDQSKPLRGLPYLSLQSIKQSGADQALLSIAKCRGMRNLLQL